VDDEPKFIKRCSAWLENAGLEVRPAKDALTALRSVVHEKPALILALTRKAGSKGFALLARLKAHRQTASIPVFAISAQDTVESRLAAFDAGCAAYITRPFHPRRLARQIVRFLREQAESA
jgi:DNA-binding response OmpR family regulator